MVTSPLGDHISLVVTSPEIETDKWKRSDGLHVVEAHLLSYLLGVNSVLFCRVIKAGYTFLES